MKRPAVALIDGEHYPSAVVAALQQASDEFDFRAAVFLGGSEKIRSGDFKSEAEAVYGLPVVFDNDWSCALAMAISRYRVEVVVDLSDEPVLGYEERFRLISESLARDVGYVGSGFHFSPASCERVCTSPSLSVIGTGKRVGKTAIAGYFARVLQGAITGPGGHPGVVIVAMGRGGPAEPELIDGRSGNLSVSDLLGWSRQGRHAASDHFEDAVISAVKTIGCRRCGAGLAGQPVMSNVADGVALANTLRPRLIVLEGSGAAIPPVHSDVRVLVAGADQPVGHIAGYLGTYRLLISDAVVLTMAEEPLASADKVRAILERVGEVRPGADVVPVVFRPRPLEDVAGKRVAFFSTAPESQKQPLSRYLEERWGCRVVLASTNLADRAALRADLASRAMDRVEVVLTELKAAAIDVVAEEAGRAGMPVVPVDNVPVEVPPASPGRLSGLAEEMWVIAVERFRERS